LQNTPKFTQIGIFFKYTIWHTWSALEKWAEFACLRPRAQKLSSVRQLLLPQCCARRRAGFKTERARFKTNDAQKVRCHARFWRHFLPRAILTPFFATRDFAVNFTDNF
jgi:hypothetical protein